MRHGLAHWCVPPSWTSGLRLPAALLLVLAGLLSSCGGGGDAAPPSPSLPPLVTTLGAQNYVPVTVEPALNLNVNIPTVSVTLCEPGTNTCQTIDRIQVDTGSTGLRVFDTAVTALNLRAKTYSNGLQLATCARFVNSYTWGVVKTVDIRMADETALNIPVQLIAASAPVAQVGCGPDFMALTSSNDLGANGILGVGRLTHDAQSYYTCNTLSDFSSCTEVTAISSAYQVKNPVAGFAMNNNGVLLELPAISATGERSVTGRLIFGVDTQDNNRLASANVVPINSWGFFTTTYKGVAMPDSFFDSGSNGLFFNDASLPRCSGSASDFYCPASTTALSATLPLSDGSNATVNFSVANLEALVVTGNFAYANLAGGGTSDASFDWGLPFYYGRRVFTIMIGATVGGRSGPFYAYAPL
jgi:hypothetical protein